MGRRHFRGVGAVLTVILTLGSVAGGVSNAEVLEGVTVEHKTVRSFDNTPIAYSIFLPPGVGPARKVPVMFVGHGWGGSRAQTTTADCVNPDTVALFLCNDYAVVSWDARGFGASGGEANVDSQEFEVKDVQAIISDVAKRNADEVDPETGKHHPRDILTEDSSRLEKFPADCAEGELPPCFEEVLVPPSNPVMGMYGGSYAGGIQLMTAAADKRVDAIAPEIAWNDLPQSLKPGGVLKLGWDLLLYGAGLATATADGLASQQTGAYASQIHVSLAEGVALNDWSAGTHAWFDRKSPKHFVNGGSMPDGTTLPGINIPTLVIQGVNDTLFNLNEGIANFKAVRARVGAEKTKMIWFCGGHTITPPAAVNAGPMPVAQAASCTGNIPAGGEFANNRQLIRDRVIRWMDRWVKGNDTVDTGPTLEYQLQDGRFFGADDLPSQVVADMTNSQSRVTHVAGSTNGQVTAGAPAGCIPEGNTAAATSAGYWRAHAQFRVDHCPIARADWVPLGTMTGTPPFRCGPVVLGKQPCVPTFEQIKPGTVFLGSPRLRLRLTGTPAPETYLFFKLVDYNTKTKESVVVGDQVTALKVSWLNLNTPQFVELDLAAVSWEVKPDHIMFLEMAPNSNDHASSRYPASVTAIVDATFPGVAPRGTFSAERVGFPNTAMKGTSASKLVTLTNTGGKDLVLTTASINQFSSSGGPILNITTGAPVPSNEFKVVGDGCSAQTLAPGASCEIALQFTPGSAGTKYAGLLLPAANGPVTPNPVLLSGLAVTPLSPDPTRLGFGYVPQGETSVPLPVTYTNATTVDVTLGAAKVTNSDGKTLSPDFAIHTDGCAGLTLAPGEQCTVTTVYKPLGKSAHSGLLQMPNDNALPCGVDANNKNRPCEQVTVTGTSQIIAPLITMDTPRNREVKETQPIAFEGTASDDIGVDSITVTIRQVGAGTTVKETVCDGCPGQGVLWSLSQSLATGVYDVFATAKNLNGLTTNTPTVTIIVE